MELEFIAIVIIELGFATDPGHLRAVVAVNSTEPE